MIWVIFNVADRPFPRYTFIVPYVPFIQSRSMPHALYLRGPAHCPSSTFELMIMIMGDLPPSCYLCAPYNLPFLVSWFSCTTCMTLCQFALTISDPRAFISHPLAQSLGDSGLRNHESM